MRDVTVLNLRDSEAASVLFDRRTSLHRRRVEILVESDAIVSRLPQSARARLPKGIDRETRLIESARLDDSGLRLSAADRVLLDWLGSYSDELARLDSELASMETAIVHGPGTFTVESMAS